MRHAGYDQMKELDRIYENCLPTYQMYVKRGDFETLGQLFQFAVEFESIQHRDRIRLQSQDCSYRSLGQAHGNTRESPKSQMPANAVQARNPFRGSPQTPSQPRPNIMPREEISNRLMNQEALSGGGISVLATVDSGTTRSFINETLLRQLKASVTVREVCTGIRLADGTSVSITGMVVTNIDLGGQVVELALLVMNSMLNKVVLGLDFLCAIGTTIRCGRARLHLREVGPKATRTNENHHAGNRPVMANLQGVGAEVTQEGSTADMEDVRKANWEITEVEERTKEHTENELEEGERIQENQGTQDEATPPPRGWEWSVADQEHINRFLQQELEELEGMSGVSHIA